MGVNKDIGVFRMTLTFVTAPSGGGKSTLYDYFRNEKGYKHKNDYLIIDLDNIASGVFGKWIFPINMIEPLSHNGKKTFLFGMCSNVDQVVSKVKKYGGYIVALSGYNVDDLFKNIETRRKKQPDRAKWSYNGVRKHLKWYQKEVLTKADYTIYWKMPLESKLEILLNVKSRVKS